jgi:hypothetical protein
MRKLGPNILNRLDAPVSGGIVKKYDVRSELCRKLLDYGRHPFKEEWNDLLFVEDGDKDCDDWFLI